MTPHVDRFGPNHACRCRCHGAIEKAERGYAEYEWTLCCPECQPEAYGWCSVCQAETYACTCETPTEGVMPP